MMNGIIRGDLEEIYRREDSWGVLDGRTVLLTGAYGMLASYVLYLLAYLRTEKGIKLNIIAQGRSQAKFNKRMGETAGQSFIRFVESDLTRETGICGDVDYIIHAASLASPQYYGVCPVDVLLPNVIGNYNLLRLATEKNVQGYLFFSTGDIYGSVTGIRCITEQDYGTMDTLDLHNCYSESKRMAETMCMAFHRQYGVPVKIARIWHTYAPTMDIENDPRVFASFVKNIVNGQDIEMKSDGGGRRSFCYITDAVSGYFRILLHGGPGEAYNVCNSGQHVSIRELAQGLAEIYPERGLRVVCRKRDESDHYTENILLKGRDVIPSDKKLKSLGWKPEINIREGFRRVIESIEMDRE